MNLTTFKNLEWYILNETDKGKLLFLKDSFNKEQIREYFKDSSMIDKMYEYCVKFNKDIHNPWFRDSYIRKELNSNLANFLGKENLNTMITTVELDGEEVTTEDKVRLITVEEVEKLPKEVLKTEKAIGYSTMSPSGFYSSHAYVFYVYGSDYPGSLNDYRVDNAIAVRPVIYLKNQNIISENDELDKEFKRLKKLLKL